MKTGGQVKETLVVRSSIERVGEYQHSGEEKELQNRPAAQAPFFK
jgi:hypothetical protein